MTVHTCTMRVEKVCKVREEPAPCLITAQGATGCDGVWQCVAGRARTKCSLREAQCDSYAAADADAAADTARNAATAHADPAATDAPVDDDSAAIPPLMPPP